MNTTGDDLPWPGDYERRGPSSPLRVLIGLDDREGSAHLLAYAKVLDKAGNAIARGPPRRRARHRDGRSGDRDA